MRVQHNIPAMNSYRNYNNNAKSINKNLEKLSSGYRINRAGDDAAGLAISEKMRAQITGLEVAQKNAKDGISLVQTAEGALTEVHDMLNRMYSLAEQAGNGTYDNSVDRTQLNKEVIKLREEIDRIGQTTNFNGTKLFTANVNGNEMKVEGVDGVHAAFSIPEDASDKTALLGKTMNINAGFATKDGYDYKSVNIKAPSGYSVLAKTGLDTLNASDARITDGSAGASVNVTMPAGSTGGKVTFQVVDSTDKTKVLADVEVDLSAFNPVKSSSAQQSGTLTFTDPNPPTDVTAQSKTPTGVTLTGSGIDLWVGDFPDSNNKINVQLKEISSDILVIDDAHVNLSSQQSALNSLSYIKDAIDYVSDLRGTLGAAQNRLEHTINNLSVMQENIQDAESTIRDTDVAEEMMKYTKNSILVQSAQAMLAQANQQPQSVLQLLQ